MSQNLDKITPEIASKFGAYAAAQRDDKTQVLLIADTNHFKIAETLGAVTHKSFWDEIKKTGKKPVFATELMPIEQQPMIEALSQGKISKQEFVESLTSGDGSEQITKAEQVKIMSNIADMVQAGVRVVGINNSQSMGGEYLKKANEIGVKLELGWIDFKRNNAAAMQGPEWRAFVENMIAQGHEKLDTMGANQRREYLEDSTKITAKMQSGQPIYERDIKFLYNDMHPQYNDFVLYSIATKDPAQNNRDMAVRASKDDEVVRLIQAETSAPDTLVVVSYGILHMKEFHKSLERAGVNPSPVITPYLGDDHFNCEKPENQICNDIGKNPNEVKDEFDKSLKGVPVVNIPNIYGMK